jgi:glycosyltransferase involved in cell wall biosynthesis
MLPSAFTATKYVANGIISKDKAYVIPTFFNDDEFKIEEVKNKRGIIYAGRLVEEKGVLELLKIASKIPHIPITIIGDGPLKNEVKKAKQENLNITYLPFLNKPQLLDKIASHKILVLPSLWYDVLPNIIIESYFVNTLVIAPNKGVFPSLIQNNKTGLLYKYGNSQSLINAIEKLIKSKLNYAKYFAEEKRKYALKEHYDKLISLLKN